MRELAFYRCAAPTATPLRELVRVAGARWAIEECFQTAKNEAGLDHYQVRSWRAGRDALRRAVGSTNRAR